MDAGKDFTGTDKGDLFNASETTLTTFDSIDGGLGNDTLNILAVGAALDTTTIVGGVEVKNVETVTIKGALAVTADTTSWTGTNTLNVTKANTSATLTAAATTDVNVSGVTGTVAVDGGKNVNVTVAATGTTTTIGATTGATGKVTVTDAAQNGAIKVDGGTDVTITASGNNAAGDTIDVGTQATPILPTGAVKVTSTGEISDNGATDAIAMGAINIAGGSTVTVTQSAGITDAQKTAALTATTNDTVTQGAVNVDGGAATTSVTVVQDAAVAALNTAAPGNTANKIGVVAGAVTIADKNSGSLTLANTITTVSLTNYASTSSIDSAALTTVNLEGTAGTLAINAGSLTTATVSTLALNVKNLSDNISTDNTITVDPVYKTLNVTNSGTSTITDLVANSATALTVAGSGDLSFTASTLLANVTSVNVTNTGSTTFGTTVLDKDATFTAAGGSETVTVGTTTKAISMGAGNDEVILDSTTNIASITGSIDGGAGTADRLTFETFAHAVAATATNVFEGKISNFEELKLDGANGTTGVIIDLGNLDDISKVVVSKTNTQDFSLDNMANNGTLRVEASQIDTKDITVIVKNAVLSTTDVMNIELAATAGLTNVDVTVANVETINVKTEDTNTTVANLAHALDLNAAAATSVVVTGNAGVDFTGSAFDDANFTSFDASAVTAGAVTYTSGALVKASTVKGGAGNDVINMAAATAAVVLSGNAGNDTLTGGKAADTINGGEGNDIIFGNEGADTLTGGAGADVFAVLTATHSNGVNVDKITDFVSGTDKVGAGDAANTDAITYAGEANSYGEVLTALDGTKMMAVLDTSTKIVYIDVDGDKALTSSDIAIKVNVSDMSQVDFATFTTDGGNITLTAGQDTIYVIDTGAPAVQTITHTNNGTGKITVTDTDNSGTTTDGDIFAGSFDVINGFVTTSDTLDIGTSTDNTLAAGAGDTVTGLAANEYELIQGTWNAATNKFTADSVNGTDTLVAFNNANGTLATDDAGIVLVGTIAVAADLA